MTITPEAYLNMINARYPTSRTPLRAANLAANAELIHALLGLNGEVGELTDEIKKSLMYGRPMDQKKLLSEAGDVSHYLMRVLDLLGFSFSSVLEANLNKLAERDKNQPNYFAIEEQLVSMFKEEGADA